MAEKNIMRLSFRELAERLVAEGRLWDYYLIATAIAPDGPSQRVAKEELRRALSFLSLGARCRGIFPPSSPSSWDRGRGGKGA